MSVHTLSLLSVNTGDTTCSHTSQLELSQILLLLFLPNYFPRQGLAPLDTICLLSAGMVKSSNLTTKKYSYPNNQLAHIAG